MQGEREELVKRVFPEIRHVCEQRGVVWGEVDLRWGVTDEQKAEDAVLPICLAEIERTRAGFDKEREAVIIAAHEAAEQARTALLASAAKEAASLEASARAAIEKEQSTADAAWAERANLLAVEIAQRLVSRLNGAVVSAAFLDWLLQEIRMLPAPMRDAVAANGVILEAISATPIEPGDQERYRTLIGEAFGARPQISFKVDPALIAGLELHGPHLAIANSWHADLTKILADLANDKRS
jgi:F-type H+-transporting ATPase subunit b